MVMKRDNSSVNGWQLVADFQTAFISIVTSEIVQNEANNSEEDMLQQLSRLSGGGYLNPGNIDPERQYNMSRASLDAHIKKIQAQQVEVLKAEQVRNLIEDDEALYIGRKVQVDVLLGSKSPIDGLWFSTQTGYRSNTLNKKRIKGTVQELLLDKNVLIVKPHLVPKLLNSELESYIVYIIDPDTAEPMVNLTFA